MHGQTVDEILASDNGSSVLWGLGDNEGTIRDVASNAGVLQEHRNYDSFGKAASVVENLGTIGYGVAANDVATGTGFIMYTTESVWTRFAAHPPASGASDHLIAVKYIDGQWCYDNNSENNSTNYYSFTPRASDVLVASVDFSNDTITGLQGVDAVEHGIAKGYASGDLTFTANWWNGGANVGEFTVGGTHFERSASSRSATDFVFGYTGQAVDNATGLYDYGHRWYDPSVGRFASEDPSSFSAGDMNLYRYVANNPLNNTDPTGLCGSSVNYGGTSYLSNFTSYASSLGLGSSLNLSNSLGIGATNYTSLYQTSGNLATSGFSNAASFSGLSSDQSWLGTSPALAFATTFVGTLAHEVTAGTKSLLNGDAGAALGNRAVGIVQTQTGTAFTGSVSDWARFGRAWTGDVVGVNSVVEASYGYDISNQQQLDAWQRTQRGAAGMASLTGTAAGALSATARTSVAVANPVPSTFARVVPGNLSPTTLGMTERVFVTDASLLRGLNAAQIAKQLEIPASSSFQVIEFGSEGIGGIATPIRSPSPGFMGRGVTSGGLPEFTIPNQSIPSGAVIRRVR